MEFDLSIDELRLDVEWLEQPNLYIHHAMKLADAKQRLDEAKNHMEVVKAELYHAIVGNPESYGLAKTTEAAINSAIPIQPQYQAARKAEIDARHEVQIYEAAVTGLEHRKKALENLVYLYQQQYHSEPRAKRSDDTGDRQLAAKCSKPLGENDARSSGSD